MNTSALTVFVVLSMFFGLSSFASETPVAIQSKVRLSHAKELLGSTYKKSGVRKSENIKDTSEFVHETSLKFIPKKFNKSANLISKAIVESAKTNQFDPIFLMAVIQNESSFNPNMVGSAGEIGLMQIKPSTAAWISKLYHLGYKGPKSLYNPAMNIKIGAALMHKLRNQFDAESSLYISAYNIGATRVRSMVSENITPTAYLNAVMKRYVAIYSAFKVEGTSKIRSQVAFNSVNRVIAGN